MVRKFIWRIAPCRNGLGRFREGNKDNVRQRRFRGTIPVCSKSKWRTRRFRTSLGLCHLFPECMKKPKLRNFGLTKLVPKMTDSDKKSQGRRTIADSFMRDAQRDATPWRSRADLAFEALYLYALSALGEQADNYAHPDARVLTAAAQELGLTADQIGPALEYLEHRYDPAIPDNGSAYRVLISIAKLLGAER